MEKAYIAVTSRSSVATKNISVPFKSRQNIRRSASWVMVAAISHKGHQSFARKTEKMKTAATTKIVLIAPSFTLFVTGDLSFYADQCGNHKSCS
jgi:hypothetical protein